MPVEGEGTSPDGPLPQTFLDLLEGLDELLVSSREPTGQGTVRMWFAVIPPGYVYLLTPTHTVKAARWRDDPWVRLRIPGRRESQEGVVSQIGWDEAQPNVDRLTERFSMAGAATGEALQWMLQDGSRQLLRVGITPDRRSDRVAHVDSADRR